MTTAQTLVRELEKEIQDVKDNVLSLNYEIDGLKTKAKDLEKLLDSISGNKVDKLEFIPVQKLVYGLVGIVLTGVMVAILGLVIIK